MESLPDIPSVALVDTYSEEPLRVMMVSSHRGWGGGETYPFRLAGELRARGHQVMFACRPDSRLARELVGQSIAMTPLAPRNAVDIPSVLRLAAALRRGRFQIVHGHFSRDYAPVALAARLSGAAAVLTRHNFFPLSRLTRGASARSGRVLAVSDAQRRVLIEEHGLPADRVQRIYPGVDLAALKPLSGPRQILDELGFYPGVPVFGMIGRLDPAKRIEVFLEAAALLRRSHPEAGFVLAGEGPERSHLEELARDLGLDIRFTGFFDDGPGLMRELTAFVSTGDREPFPFVCLEALASGVPVLGVRATGTIEIVADGETGILFPAGDSESLARAMRRIVEEPAAAAAMGAAARQRAQNLFSRELMLDQIITVYRDLAAKKR